MKNALKIFFILCLALAPNFATANSGSQITKLEESFWGFNYNTQSDTERLDRIEKQVFGSSNSNLNTTARIEKLTKALGLESEEEAQKTAEELYIPEKAGQGVEYPQIDQLEQVLLGSVYKSENIYSRLERLEKKAFGAIQNGDLSKRTETLKRHLANQDNSTANSQTGYQTRSYFDNDYQVNPYSTGLNDVKFQLAAIENQVFATDFSQEPVPLRLSRLENKIFQRTFQEDDDTTRISRIQAAATASRTSKYYDNNKFQKFAATGIQAASFLLMILAFIL